MSELKIDNPAQRLLDILERGRVHPVHQNCRDVWCKLLEVRKDDEQLLLSRLAKALELSGRIIQVRENHFSSLRGNSSHWKGCVEKAFISQSLNSTWQSFIQHIDVHTLNELAMLSDLFESRGAHSTMDDEEIEALIGRIAELRAEIRSSELSAEMKTLLLKQLAQIQEALESYSISGVEPVMDAVQSTLGLAVLHPEYRSEISKGTDSKFGEKMSDLLSDVANVVTVAGALPALTVAVNTALAYISQ